MFWIIVAVICLIIELLTFGLVSIWFTIGALVTLLFLNYNMLVQVSIFFIVSIMCLVILRKISTKFIKYSKELDRITDKEVKIESFINRGNEKIYTVKLDGKFWEAISDEELEINDSAVVEKVSGNKLILRKIM